MSFCLVFINGIQIEILRSNNNETKQNMEDIKMRPTTLAYNKRVYPNDLLNDLFFNNYPEVNTAEYYSKPMVNIVENEKAYVISLAAPGMNKSDFKINLDGNNLSISSAQEQNLGESAYLRQEFHYGAFTKKYELPEDADKTKIKAAYTNGVLEIEILKTKESKTVNKNIKIK